MALTDDGEVYAWGDNDEGQLGDGTLHPISRPRPIAALKVNHDPNKNLPKQFKICFL